MSKEDNTQRLQKIIAQAGIASRRKAEELILEGRVQVNGKIVTELGTKADPLKDHVRVDNKLLHGPEKHRYFMLNKPKGFVSTASDPQHRPTVTQFFSRAKARVFPVGRLDFESEGLLLVTNDGELTNGLTRASAKVEKTYLVKVAGIPAENKLEQIRRGIMIERGKPGTREGRVLSEPVRLTLVREADNPWYEVILTEGRNRQIRKLFEEIGHHVEKIRRVGYGPLVLDVEPGQFRELNEREIFLLTKASKRKAPEPGAPAPKPASLVNRPKKLLQKIESKVLPKPAKKWPAKKKKVRPGIKSGPKKPVPRFGSALKKSKLKAR
jgi:23S rRNA pseudouridine2605 synthase